MPNKWRPYGWELPHRFVITPSLLELSRAQDSDEVKFYQNEAYEAGADAMLEALRKQGKFIDASKYPYGFVLNEIHPIQKLKRDFKGYLIIIPDEEVVNV